MPFTVNMPKLSPTMSEGTIASWLKKEGDFVEAGELLLEIATDKATVEHTALDEGWLRKILIKEGQAAQINQPIAIFTASPQESIEGFAVEPVKQKDVPIPPSEVVSKPQVLSEIPQLASTPAFAPEAPLKEWSFDYSREESKERIVASPLAKKIAQEKGLDLSSIKGTGPGGRITSQDLEKALPQGIVSFGRRETPTTAPGTYEEIPLSPIRKIVSKRLQESKTYIPHFYVKQTVDASALVSLREQLKSIDLNVTFNDLIIRATALALRKHPEINSGFHAANQALVRYKTIDISVAVSVNGGLITPIVRHADYKTIGEISVEVRNLAERAKQGKLAEQEYKGGSFCISNLGMYGITEFYAIINPPQGAILAVGGIADAAVVREGKVVAGKTLQLTLSVDHRAIDGAEAAKFLKTLRQLLENPVTLTIG